jgi:hypothetical protein
MTANGSSGGGVSPRYNIFRATWNGSATMTSKTFTEDNGGTETEVTSYTITAYFYR